MVAKHGLGAHSALKRHLLAKSLLCKLSVLSTQSRATGKSYLTQQRSAICLAREALCSPRAHPRGIPGCRICPEGISTPQPHSREGKALLRVPPVLWRLVGTSRSLSHTCSNALSPSQSLWHAGTTPCHTPLYPVPKLVFLGDFCPTPSCNGLILRCLQVIFPHTGHMPN